jgi:hypothetical protein
MKLEDYLIGVLKLMLAGLMIATCFVIELHSYVGVIAIMLGAYGVNYIRKMLFPESVNSFWMKFLYVYLIITFAGGVLINVFNPEKQMMSLHFTPVLIMLYIEIQKLYLLTIKKKEPETFNDIFKML